MQCNFPKLFITKEATFEVPCGRCTACRTARAHEWSIRLMHEFEFWDDSVFLTLTYDDVHLPEDNAVSKRELQLFFKRIRKRVSPISYYACGEYGENYGRPHYHAIVFGLSFRDKQIVEDSWRLGFVKLGLVSYQSCRYVANYIGKAFNGDVAKKFYGNRLPPFQISSNGIGLRWAQRHEDQLIANGKITVHGQDHGIPKYYRRKLDLLYNYEELKELRDLANETVESYHKDGKSIISVRELKEDTLNAKLSLRRKGKL